jgi:hypothetical protein
VKLVWKAKGIAVVLGGICLLSVGCSGINTSYGVSPATFLLPGLIQNSAPSMTNDMLVLHEFPIIVAQAQ